MLAFRIKALKLYAKIAEMLQLQKDTSLIQDMKDFEHVKGWYKYESASFYIRGEKELRSRQFHNDSPVGPGASVYPYGKSHLIIHRDDKKDENWLAKIEYGEDGEVLGLSWFALLVEVDGKRIIQPKIE